MATKKPSAAQIAARKLFAARAKAGAFGRPAAKKRKRNPASGKDHDIGEPAWTDTDEELFRNPVARSGHSRNANNLGRSGHSRNANNLSRSRSGPAYSRIDPRESGERVKRKVNPDPNAAIPPTAFWIHRVKANGERGLLVAIITQKPDALKFAREYADDHKTQVAVVGRK